MSNTRHTVRRATALANKGKTLDALVLVLRHTIEFNGEVHYVGLNRTEARRTARDILAKRKTITFNVIEDSKGNEYQVPVVRDTLDVMRK